ncbi:MAG: hypothetical protein ACI8Y7_000286 [Candidatus Woesearchaeota archaeon]|jgi:hypothetical protein
MEHKYVIKGRRVNIETRESRSHTFEFSKARPYVPGVDDEKSTDYHALFDMVLSDQICEGSLFGLEFIDATILRDHNLSRHGYPRAVVLTYTATRMDFSYGRYDPVDAIRLEGYVTPPIQGPVRAGNVLHKPSTLDCVMFAQAFKRR